MKKILVLSFFAFFTLFAEGKVFVNMDRAIVQAQRSNKYILVDFTGSDWCVWCKKLKKEVFPTDRFDKYAKNNLVFLEFDFPQNIPQTDKTKAYNQKMSKLYGITGFPTILILDKNGRLVGRTGYQEGGAKEYISHLESFFR